MSAKPELRGVAVSLVAIGGVMIAVGSWVALSAEQGLSAPTAGILFRTGAVLVAIALVVPSIRKPSIPTLVIAAAGVLLVLARPGLLWVAIIGWSLWVLTGRQRRTDKSDS